MSVEAPFARRALAISTDSWSIKFREISGGARAAGAGVQAGREERTASWRKMKRYEEVTKPGGRPFCMPSSRVCCPARRAGRDARREPRGSL